MSTSNDIMILDRPVILYKDDSPAANIQRNGDHHNDVQYLTTDVDDGIFYQIEPEHYDIPLIAPHKDEIYHYLAKDNKECIEELGDDIELMTEYDIIMQLIINRVDTTQCRVTLEMSTERGIPYTLFEHIVTDEIARKIDNELATRGMYAVYQGQCW